MATRKSSQKGRPGERRARRSFTPKFKAGVVELVRRGDRTVGEIARDLDLTETAVRHWVNRDAEGGRTMAGPVTTAESEREELVRLGAEIKLLKMERDILKKATILFAAEST